MAAPCSNSDVKAMDILCGRTKFCTDHVGSIAYKAILETRLPRYMDPNTESCDKTSMTIELVKTITAGGGRFLREKKTGSGVWEVLCKTAAREKIRDGLRDAVKIARKNEGGAATGPYLTKVGLSLEVTEETSFAELVSRISEEPVMKQFLFESKMRQGAMDRKQKRIESHNASRKLSASTAKGSVKYSQMFVQQCSSSAVGNFVPIMPPAAQQFVQVQLPLPQQPLLLPKLPSVPTPHMHMELKNGHVMPEKEKFARSSQQALYTVPSFLFPDYGNLSSMSSRSMLLNDDPSWGEGDFEKVADPHGGSYLLEALQQADKLTDFPSNPQEAADKKDKNILDPIGEEAHSDRDDLLEAFERVDELFEAVNFPVTREGGLDNNKNTETSNDKNTQNPNDEDDLPEALERADDYFEAPTADLPSNQVASSDNMNTAGTSKPSSGAYKRTFTRTAWSTWLMVKRQRRIHQEEPLL